MQNFSVTLILTHVNKLYSSHIFLLLVFRARVLYVIYLSNKHTIGYCTCHTFTFIHNIIFYEVKNVFQSPGLFSQKKNTNSKYLLWYICRYVIDIFVCTIMLNLFQSKYKIDAQNLFIQSVAKCKNGSILSWSYIAKRSVGTVRIHTLMLFTLYTV